ncbi:MAG: SUMF1/EgtB/PvdO family nonheme iron enzyme, partial [Verrucomicrobiota bacterium]
MKALRLSLLPLFILISGQASEPPELEEFRLNFQIEISEAKAATKEFNSKYESYLEKQKTAYQAEGKLEAMLAVEKELENYESSTTLSSYPELKRLQEIYRKQMPQLASEEVAESLKVITAYREKAEQLAKQWTKDGKIEEAKSALAEAKRFEAMAEDLALVKLTTNPAPVVRSDDFGGREGGQETTNGLGMKLCWIPSGRFTMGSPPDEPERSGNELQVRVRITKGFWMGKYEVTQEEFEAVMEMNPSANRLGARGPVEQVRWTEAVLFGEKLTERERAEGRLPEGWIYRLPT